MNIFQHVRAAISLFLMLLNGVFWCSIIFVGAFLKFIIPIPVWRKFCSRVLIVFPTIFIDINGLVLRFVSGVSISVDQEGEFEAENSYLLVSNHQSYADIILLQKLFIHKIPFLKFFLKQELIWIPFFGIAWWALDFPFMKRYSREYLRKHPEKAGKDFEATKKACEKFKDMPVSIMNFTEGTRFNQEKHGRQESPFENLLKPKAGGVGYVISLLGEQIDQLIDVTIKYNDGDPTLWSFLGGKLSNIEISVKVLMLPEEIKGDYINDSESRIKVQRWLNQLWKEKDNRLSS